MTSTLAGMGKLVDGILVESPEISLAGSGAFQRGEPESVETQSLTLPCISSVLTQHATPLLQKALNLATPFAFCNTAVFIVPI